MNNNTSTQAPPEGQAPEGTATPAQAATEPTSNGQAPNETPSSSPEDLQRQIAELRRENAAHRRKSKEQEEANAKAQADALAEQGRYKELYEQQLAQVIALKPIEERYSTLTAQVASQIDTQIKDWPREVTTFDPGADAPIEQRLAWVEKSKPLIAKLAEQQRAQSPGNGPNPRPSGGTPETQQNKYYQQMRQSGKYGV